MSKQSPLMKLAKAVYEEHGFSPEGVECLERKITEDKEVLDEAVHQAAYDSMRVAMQLDRRAISTQATTSHGIKTFTEEEQQTITANTRGFFSRPLTNGSPLGSATRELLEQDIVHYQRQIQGCSRELRFLSKVLDRVGEDQKVSDVWTEEQLEKLYARLAKFKTKAGAKM